MMLNVLMELLSTRVTVNLDGLENIVKSTSMNASRINVKIMLRVSMELIAVSYTHLTLPTIYSV